MMKNANEISIVFVAAMLLFPLGASALVTGTATLEPVNNSSPQIDAIVQNATSMIDTNQILTRIKGDSSFVGIGTVEKIGYDFLDDWSGRIVTSADLIMEVPLAGSVKSNQTVTVRYDGGTIGDETMAIFFSWAVGPADTVRLPSPMKLDVGMRVLFFAQQKVGYIQLITYVPFSTENAETALIPSSNNGDLTILSETQPSTTVSESSGNGFAWANGWHWNWGDLPVKYNIDPQGTADISGTSEFDAIRTSFATWENLRFSGIDFTDNGTGIDVSTWIDDTNNVLFWMPTTDNSWIGGTAVWEIGGHIHGVDTAFNDYWTYSIGASPNCYDVQSIATHEIGHWLAIEDLHDSSNLAQTEYWGATLNDVHWRTLEWGDENGAHYVYPVHNDAGSGADGSNTLAGAGSISKGITYYGRLCDLPSPDHALDTQDYYKFYAGSTSRLAFSLFPPSNADFDLELYNPSGVLTYYSRNRGNGVSEIITRDGGMGVTGWWTLRVVRYSTGGQGGNGEYQFKFADMPLLPQP